MPFVALESLNGPSKHLLVAEYHPFTMSYLFYKSSAIVLNGHNHGKDQQLLVSQVLGSLKDRTILVDHSRKNTIARMWMNCVGHAKGTRFDIHLDIGKVQSSEGSHRVVILVCVYVLGIFGLVENFMRSMQDMQKKANGQ